jgi:Bacterial transcriptional activator domain
MEGPGDGVIERGAFAHGAGPAVVRVQLLYPNARVFLSGPDAPVEIRKACGTALRLLALSAGQCISAESLALALEYSTTRSVAPMIKKLRELLGAGQWGHVALRNDHRAGYRLDPGLIQLDAFEFRGLVEPVVQEYGDCADVEDLPPAAVAEQKLAMLERAAGLWRANPAIGLEDLDEAGHQYYYEFDVLHDGMVKLQTLLAMRVGTLPRLRHAIKTLENVVGNHHSPDSHDWCLLIRAYHSTGNPAKVQDTYARARRHYDVEYGQHVPREIEDAFERSSSSVTGFSLFRSQGDTVKPLPDVPPAQISRGDDNRASLLEVADLIGITTHPELSLTGERMEPVELMHRVRQRLWFSGVLASKWVQDTEVLGELDEFLTVLDHSPQGDVRFMIMNPDGYRRLRELRGDEISAEHLPVLARLTRQHSSFQVKVFSHLPRFRIHVLDNDVVTFSSYRLDEESYLPDDQKPKSPHVVLDPLAPFPLADAFASLFREMWQNSSFLDPERYA